MHPFSSIRSSSIFLIYKFDKCYYIEKREARWNIGIDVWGLFRLVSLLRIRSNELPFLKGNWQIRVVLVQEIRNRSKCNQLQQYKNRRESSNGGLSIRSSDKRWTFDIERNKVCIALSHFSIFHRLKQPNICFSDTRDIRYSHSLENSTLLTCLSSTYSFEIRASLR